MEDCKRSLNFAPEAEKTPLEKAAFFIWNVPQRLKSGSSINVWVAEKDVDVPLMTTRNNKKSDLMK